MSSQALTNTSDRHMAKAVRALRSLPQRLSSFVQAYPPHRPYYWARHTKALCRALQDASDAVLRGERRFLIVVMPPQHGKSDLASRRFPAWHLLRAPDQQVIITGYSGALATDMSLEARRVFREVAPGYGIALDEARQRVEAWRTTKGGAVFAVGLGGTITGRGANILVVDDYLQNREEAESQVMRDKIWDSFRNDLMTRLAPACAVVIPCTRWHEDDLVGRILRTQETEPDFPHFDVLRFPALSEDGKWLFPEKYSAEHYKQARAVLSTYFWQACFQGDPRPRRGNLLRADLVEIVEADAIPNGDGRWARGWDLASSAKERMSDDPDYTVGLLAGMHEGVLWITDVQRGQWTEGKRDARMLSVTQMDGARVRVGIEAIAGYKDTFDRMKRLLMGTAHVEKVTPDKDKVARAGALEPLFEAGRVKVKRAPWTDDLIAELQAFPGRHDDQVDALVVAYQILTRPTAGVVRL